MMSSITRPITATDRRRRQQRHIPVLLLLFILLFSLQSAQAASPSAGGLALHWKLAGVLPRPAGGLSGTTDGQYAYVSGGYNSAYLPYAYSVPLGKRGNLGKWQHIATLPTPLYEHAMVASGGSLYVIGGTTNGVDTGASDSIYRTRITLGGKTGQWVVAGHLPTRLFGSAAVVHGSTLYVIGGYSPQVGYLTGVYAITLGAHGPIGSWRTLSKLPHARYALAATVSRNTVFVVGGMPTTKNGTQVNAPDSAVYAAHLNADGTLGDWLTTTSLPVPLAYATVSNVENHLVVAGGSSSASLDKPVSSVYIASVTSFGGLGNWHTATPLTSASAGGVAIAANSYVYVMGGFVGRIYGTSVNSSCPSFATCTR